MHGSTRPVQYSLNLFYLSYRHCCQVNENASKFVKTFKFFLYCSICSMPRKPNNLREQAIGMLDAGMSTEHVASHGGCSSRAIRNLRVRF